MNRRLLLTLAGLGTSAAAVFLMSGTAHALAPPAAGPSAPPVHLGIPTAPDSGSVKTVTTKVVHGVTQVPPVKKVVESVPVVVKRVAATVDHSVTAAPRIAPRSVGIAPTVSLATRLSRASVADTSTLADARSPRPRAMRNTRTRGPSHRSTFAFMLPGLSGNALNPAPSSGGSPFAALATRPLYISTVSQWVTFPTADRTRPGFLVGSARPG